MTKKQAVKQKPKAVTKRTAARGLVSFSELLPDTRNANRGTKRGAELIAKSLKQYGAGRSILLDKNNRLIAGNKTLSQAAIAKSGIKGVRIIETDGTELIAVKRTDLDLKKKGSKAQSLAIADNRASELSLDWDPKILKTLEAEVDLSQFFEESELTKLFEETQLATLEQDVALAYRVIVLCDGEEQQGQIMQELEKRGLKCQLLIS